MPFQTRSQYMYIHVHKTKNVLQIYIICITSFHNIHVIKMWFVHGNIAYTVNLANHQFYSLPILVELRYIYMHPQ